MKNQQLKRKKTKRILHVFTALSYGGVEQVIYDYIRLLDKKEYQIDIVTQGDVVPEIGARFKALGVECYKLSPKRKGIIRHYIKLFKILRSGRYDFIHCNMSNKSFYYLIPAKMVGINGRIAHLHGASSNTQNALDRIRFRIQAYLTKKASNIHVSCSKEIGDLIFGKNDNYVILPNAIDCSRFKFNIKARRDIRKSLGIKDTDFCIGHIGRFDDNKNQSFLLQLLSDSKKEIKLLMIGNGETRSKIEKEARGDSRIIFVNQLQNPAPYYSAMDLFVFPSQFEGFGIAVIEANCAGIASICSKGVPSSTNVLGINKYISLKNKNEWLTAISKRAQSLDRMQLYKDFSNTEYNIIRGISKIEEIYKVLE